MPVQAVARQVGGDGKVGNPQILDVDAGVMVGELPVEMRVVEQAVAWPRVAPHGLVGDENLVDGPVHIVRVGAHGESGGHRPAAEVPPMMSNVSPACSSAL